MSESIELGDIKVAVTRKPIKHVHLSVHPPSGRVTLAAPTNTRLDVARAYVISKLDWIRAQRSRLQSQAREAPRQFVTRETHFLWGRPYLLTVRHEEAKPRVSLDHRRMTLTVRPGSSAARRAEVIHHWHKALLHEVVPGLIRKWERKLGIEVRRYFLQRMKTRWGGCNHRAGHIRLNTELVKKPKDLLEYVIVHEMIHLIEPTHSERFIELMTAHYPFWKEARAELNEMPLGAEVWDRQQIARSGVTAAGRTRCRDDLKELLRDPRC
ncbi:MAG TPA: SprT family zinc-dependent metalloprotease [Steroidobacter sp.]|uniref:M48 family metallopeptidase n=1 Tax=Steroidobacter sp. TaxID=1978227 RepID=UPI002EDAE830